MNQSRFTVKSTNACKGIALILLLWHHLFYQHPEFGYIVHTTAHMSKVCVAIFVILSGYGFSESIKRKPLDILQFYKDRLVSIYLNYWLIAFIFVFIGTFFMNRTLNSVFTSHPYAKFIVQMTGLYLFAYDGYGYNATWWYMSVIIPLIILFPFIYDATKKYGFFLLFCFLFILIPGKPIVFVLNEWLLPFALGIYLSQRNLIVAISGRLSNFRWWRYIILLFFIVLVAAFRNYIPLWRGTRIDWLFGLLIILFTFELTIVSQWLVTVLSILGEHLFNVFLFHTFIYYYFWEDFIYSFKNPLLIFAVLLFLCIALSQAIEYLKRVIGFYYFSNKLKNLRMPAVRSRIGWAVPTLSHDTVQ